MYNDVGAVSQIQERTSWLVSSDSIALSRAACKKLGPVSVRSHPGMTTITWSVHGPSATLELRCSARA
jgi:hypothetical protein